MNFNSCLIGCAELKVDFVELKVRVKKEVLILS